MTDRAIVQIGTTALGQSLDDEAPVFGVADIRIRWGRSSIHDDVKAETLTMTMIDPDGAWSTNSTRVGEPMIITRIIDGLPNRIVFRGAVTDLGTRPVKIKRRKMWLTKISASGKVADISPLAAQPYLTNSETGAITSGDAWFRELAASRLNKLWLTLQAIVSSIEQIIRPIDMWTYIRGWRDLAGTPKALEHLALIYRTQAYGYPLYNPHTNAITIGKHGTAPGVALVATNGKYTVASTTSRTIPASHIELPAGEELTATPREALSAIRILHVKASDDPLNPIEISTTYPTNAPPSATKILDVKIGLYQALDTASWGSNFSKPDTFAPDILDVINANNGYLHLPDIRISSDRLTGNTALDDELLSTIPTQQPIHISGNQYLGLNTVARSYNLIGGQLTFDKHGWRNQITPSAVAPLTEDTVRLSALSTNANLTLADADPALTLGDLTTVTIGLT